MEMPVRSISQCLLDSEPAFLRVLSRHHRVVNLEDERGRLWAVVHPQIGNGPFHIVLAEQAEFAALERGAAARWDGRTLTAGTWRMHADAAKIWDPFLARAPRPIPAASWKAARRCAQTIMAASPLQKDMDAHTWTRLRQGVALLNEARQAEDAAGLREAAARLTGLGPGLTPAGDDVLLGFMARGWIQHSAICNPYSVIRELEPAWAEKGKTSRISRAWLEHAAAGRFAEPWHDLRAAMSAADVEAVCRAMARIAGIGATSGRLALLGAFSMP